MLYTGIEGGIHTGYKVKWVEDNLEVTRKALRGFEKAGLMPKNTGCQYRDYDEDDIDCIWTIRVFQGMGYTLKEIANMVNDENFNFDDSIAQKIEELEKEKRKVEMHLGYAKTIKLTGRFPFKSGKNGKMNFNEFQQVALERWNIYDDSQGAEYAKIADTILSKPASKWEKSDLGRVVSMAESVMQMDNDLLLAEYVLPRAIVKRQHLGANHPDIQCLVKLIYENQNSIMSDFDKDVTLTKQQFARFYSTSYMSGDIASLKATDFNEEDCRFIAEAVSFFGGFENYDALIDAERHYGR